MFQKTEATASMARTRVHRASYKQASRRRAALFLVDNREKLNIPLPNMTCRQSHARLAPKRTIVVTQENFSKSCTKIRTSSVKGKLHAYSRGTCSCVNQWLKPPRIASSCSIHPRCLDVNDRGAFPSPSVPLRQEPHSWRRLAPKHRNGLRFRISPLTTAIAIKVPISRMRPPQKEQV